MTYGIFLHFDDIIITFVLFITWSYAVWSSIIYHSGFGDTWRESFYISPSL